jgi:hypothetical protein
MAKSLNGNTKWLIGLLILAAGVVGSYAVLGHIVSQMEPDVRKNTEHRIQDEVDTKYIKEKISDIERVQQEILAEVRK